MAKVFIGIALAIMLATAALGFLAKGNIDKLQSTLKGTKADLVAEAKKVRDAQAEVKKSTEERDAANTKAEEAAKQLTAKETEVTGLKGQVDAAKKLADDQTADVVRITEELRVAKEGMVGKPVPDDPRIAELTAQVAKAQAAAADAKLAADSMVNRLKDTETKLSAAELKERQRAQISGRAGLQARILAVNPGWNFVVLSVGDKQGVAVNAPLLVIRGNEPIARLRITSVEPSTSIADVIPGSVRRGVSVQAGDTVIFEGRSSATQPPTSSGPMPEPAAPTLPN